MDYLMQKIDPKVTEKTFFPDFAPCHNEIMKDRD